MVIKDATFNQVINYTENPEEVIDGEKERIVPKKDKADFNGLAISGGGIRSASFGIGVLQALAEKDVLKKFDYLSTVSGGGYVGSSLSWFLHKGIPGKGKAGVDSHNFPFGRESGIAILDFIRQHGNYLTPTKGLDFLSLIGVTLRSMFITLFFYLSLLTLLMSVLFKVNAFDPFNLKQIIPAQFLGVVLDVQFIGYLLPIALVGVVILVSTSLIFSFHTYFSLGDKIDRYRYLIQTQKMIGKAWSLIIFLVLIGLLPYLKEYIGDLILQLSAGTLTGIGIANGIFQYRKVQSSQKAKDAEDSQLRLWIGVFALLYGLLLAGYIFGYTLSLRESSTCFYGLLAFTFLLGIFVNLNYVGLHRMYRDRLMETFLPNANNVQKNSWGPATEADRLLLKDVLTETRPQRPYQLINTNIVLVDSPVSKYRSRGGDSFLLSPLFCGSEATGWRRTDQFMQRGRRGMTLSTAMAISAAAVNPNASEPGGGVTKNRMVSAILSILNFRLGYWVRNPNNKMRWPFPPNFIFPGLLSCDLSENSGFNELTDGGHFENLGLYELIRRRLKLILVSDGGCDPDFLFGDLANAIEKIRVDFGATLKFREKYGLQYLLPNSEEGQWAEKYKLAKQGFAVADIEYADKTKGMLILLKTTLIKDLPEDIYGYKSFNPSFPDQPTSDQFFDERQFEAYRELGYRITLKMTEAINIDH